MRSDRRDPGRPDMPCWLCGEVRRLRHSHAIPDFVFRHFKQGSNVPFFQLDRPTQSVSSYGRAYMYCAGCEGRFNRWETPFNNHLFKPWHERELRAPVEVGPWALPFAVSVCYRVAEWHARNGTEFGEGSSVDARARWREYLLGEAEHPGPYEQHLVDVETVVGDRASGLSREAQVSLVCSITGATHFADRGNFVFAKLGRLMLFGMLDDRSSRGWNGFKLRTHRHSLWGAGKPRMPPSVVDWMWTTIHGVAGRIQATPRQDRVKLTGKPRPSDRDGGQ